MSADEVITLDSDDEDTNSTPTVSNILNNGNNAGITIKRIPAAPKVIPRPGTSRLPLPPELMQGPVNRAPIVPSIKKAQVPRKPGVFPPFALFSQEQRPQILRMEPNISFGEIGRKLGEMWHSLTEIEKEEYRRRAREISDQKMAEYNSNLASMPPQQRQMAIHANSPAQKKKKTHGYAIFSAEMKKNLGNAMSPQETANVIAESWRSATPSVRKDYEDRATRINIAQARRLQQLTASPTKPQQHSNHFNNSSMGPGLRISSVSSLSPQPKRLMNRPTPPAPAPLGPKLPSGITISRVEPEISIVDENVQNYHQPVQPPPPVVSRMAPNPNRGMMNNRMRGGVPAPSIRRPVMSPAAQAAMRVKAQLRAQNPGNHAMGMGGQWANNVTNQRVAPPRPYMNNGQQRMMQHQQVYRGPGGTGGLKRPMPRVGPNMMPMKKVRANVPPVEQKLCRSCGFINPVGCRLAERTEMLAALSELTMTHIDLVKDQVEGYPGEICRRCMCSLNNFISFKKTFNDGQEKLRLKFGAPSETVASESSGLLPLPDSIVAETSGLTPVTIASQLPPAEEESILPDLDLEMDFGENPANIPQPVDIKEERVRLLSPTIRTISIKEEVGKPMNSENIVQGGKEEKIENKTEVAADPLEEAPAAIVEAKAKEEDTKNDELKQNGHEKSELGKDETDPFKNEEQHKIVEKSPEQKEGKTQGEPVNQDVNTVDNIAERSPTEEVDNIAAGSPADEVDNIAERNPTEEVDNIAVGSPAEEIDNIAERSPETSQSSTMVGGDDPLNCNDLTEETGNDNNDTIIEDERIQEVPQEMSSNQSNGNDEAMDETTNDDEETRLTNGIEDPIDESSNGVVPEMDEDGSNNAWPAMTTDGNEESFVSCNAEGTSMSNDDPFNQNSMEITAGGDGSQDANDAFVPQTDDNMADTTITEDGNDTNV